MGSWQLADAKNRFSELVRKALTQGPQRVTRRGESVVVMSERDFERLAGKRPSFKDYLLKGPTFDGLDLTRSADKGRDVHL